MKRPIILLTVSFAVFALFCTGVAKSQNSSAKVKKPIFVESLNDSLLFDLMAMDVYDSISFDLKMADDMDKYNILASHAKAPDGSDHIFKEQLGGFWDERYVVYRKGYGYSDTLYAWRVMLLEKNEIVLNTEADTLKIFGRDFGQSVTVSTPDGKVVGQKDIRNGVTEIIIPQGLEYLDLDIKRNDYEHYLIKCPVR